MFGYTAMEFAGVKILTKNVEVAAGSVKIPVNITVVLADGGPCKLTQSRASIIPGILYYPKTLGLMKSVEASAQRCIRKFYMSSHVADRADDKFFNSVRLVLQAMNSLPGEKISTLVVPVITSPEIAFTDKLGNEMTLANCLLVPMKGTSVLIIGPQNLEGWLKVLEEAVNLKCSFEESSV
jgi:hypothetical protein